MTLAKFLERRIWKLWIWQRKRQGLYGDASRLYSIKCFIDGLTDEAKRLEAKLTLAPKEK